MYGSVFSSGWSAGFGLPNPRASPVRSSLKNTITLPAAEP
jgi:hypothetical protein